LKRSYTFRNDPEEVIAVRRILKLSIVLAAVLVYLGSPSSGLSEELKKSIYNPGEQKPIDSVLQVKVGEIAPDFVLPSVSGEKISLHQFLGKKNVVISFVPAAWTPVCSEQWPGYNIVKDVFSETDAVLLGITVDNIPTLHAWTNQLGSVWFHVLSDFWPHGAVAKTYGVLRSDGVTERALFIIDKEGLVRFIQVTDINKKPDPSVCALELRKLKQK
jgi:peroxiredoxin